jgi:ubiquinone/menaquinone biosynthesis C-methylase UbiE
MISTFTKSDWDRYAEWYDDLNILHPYAEMIAGVARRLGKKFLPILDAGCGTGNLTQALIRSTTSDVVGLDASGPMLARAKLKCPDTAFVQGDLSIGVPFGAGTFGTVVCVNTLYALPDPHHAFAEFNRTLRMNGRVIVVTPKAGYESGLILKAHCGSGKPDSYWCDVHRNGAYEKILVREAIPDKRLARRFLEIGRVNRMIARERSFRFFDKTELAKIALKNGFKNVRITETYARQSHLLIATRR